MRLQAGRRARRGDGHAVTVTVSQRITSIRDADHILVLDRGKTIGFGPHETLMEDCQVYADIVRSQQSLTGDAA